MFAPFKIQNSRKVHMFVDEDLDKHDAKVRADAIEEIKQSFHNLYSASLYCQEDMATDCKEQGCNCDDCLYVMFNKVLEQLKEQQ